MNSTCGAVEQFQASAHVFVYHKSFFPTDFLEMIPQIQSVQVNVAEAASVWLGSLLIFCLGG